MCSSRLLAALGADAAAYPMERLNRLSLVGAALVLTTAMGISGAIPATGVQQLSPTPTAVTAAVPLPSSGVTFTDVAFPAAAVGRDGHMTVTVLVANTTRSDATAKASFVLRSALGNAVTPAILSDPVRIPIGGRPAAVTVIADLSSQPGDAFPLAGVMILETSPAAAGNQDPAVIGIKTLPIASIERRSDGAEWPMLYGAFLWALLPILLVVIVLAVRMPGALRLRLGSPMWSFTDSWSSTITVAGAILTGLIGFAGLPDYGHAMSKKTYGIASLLFSSLIMLAPGVFNLFRRTMSVTSTSGAIVQQTQGLVPFFLAAALLTTAGVLAQLKLLGTLFQDLGTAAVISVQTAAAFTLLTAVLQVVLVVYAGVSTYLTVNEQAVYQAALKAAAANNIAPAPAAAPPAQLPHWKLL
jgi:hypothetical protein